MKTITKNIAIAISATSALLCAPAFAQTQSTPAPVANTQVAAQQVELGGPALWKVVDEDTTVYLFGTVHALPEDVKWMNGTISAALNSSESLVTEIAIDDSIAAQTQQLVLVKVNFIQRTS